MDLLGSKDYKITQVKQIVGVAKKNLSAEGFLHLAERFLIN